MKKYDFEYYEIKLLEKIQETKNTYTFKFSHPGHSWDEGTHVHLAFEDFMENDPKDKTYVRHLSIMNLDKEEFMGFTTRISDSPFKKRLLNLELGDMMILYKIKQRLPLRREDKDIVLISMGVGMSTMKPLIETYVLNQANVGTLTNINISGDEFVYHDFLKGLSHIDHHLVYSRKSLYDAIDLSFNADSIYYIVGSDQFLIDIIKTLIDKGVKADNIDIDKKTNKRDIIFSVATE